MNPSLVPDADPGARTAGTGMGWGMGGVVVQLVSAPPGLTPVWQAGDAAAAWTDAYVVPIVQLYEGFYHASPDIPGLTSWVNYFQSVASLPASGTPSATYGAVLHSIAGVFAGNAQFTSIYGVQPMAETFVTTLYQNVLGRAPDADGFAGYVAFLKSAGGSGPSVQAMADLALTVTQSAEAKSLSTGPIKAWLAQGAAGTFPATISGLPALAPTSDGGDSFWGDPGVGGQSLRPPPGGSTTATTEASPHTVGLTGVADAGPHAMAAGHLLHG